MTNETNRTDTLKLQDDATDAKKDVQEKLNRIANEAAKQARSRQQRYDGEQGIFTK
ncbi:MAG: hypothetical protein WA419_05030 [Silvibacterium sp.]